jgi:hypothetical protein
VKQCVNFVHSVFLKHVMEELYKKDFYSNARSKIVMVIV